ncbi:transcriptional regulator [Alkaliphilus hydrothermalis]|uniref:DNA-binding HxlR family transcriptional regulator n=1 Tax=Alkaliphilus hydrothermalis TaxID=1482730 RepID=A0ABS2NNN5_9FIRM|nr:transcriptional regulator [Alkaliphilus hydrothermalis]MBM7614466.1 DNA-binding HxlR family transcriptional regulator [Alkaliphilus hydrothermalis]
MKFTIDKVIHERVRLLILTYLASHSQKKVPFNEIKENLELTSGNLSVQLKNLEEAGFIKIFKKIKDNKPETTVSLTTAGLRGLNEYIEEMENLIKKVKGPKEN